VVSGGYQVNHQELADAGKKAGDKGQEAQSIQQKVDAANGIVPDKAWGLLGNLTVHSQYTEMFGTLQDHVGGMITGVRNLADTITGIAEEYRQNDSDAGDKFKTIEAELGDGPTTSVKGA
jgi:uncharacterized protein YukE